MKHIGLFEEFANKNQKLYYRKVQQSWLIKLLKEGSISSNPTQPENKYISLTTEKELEFDFGPCLITFSAEALDKQGAIVVEYSEEFFAKHPEISKHITDCYNKEEFLKDPHAANGAGITDDTTWEDMIERWSEEDEVVIEKIKLVPGLIVEVSCEEKIKEELRDLLRKQKPKIKIWQI